MAAKAWYRARKNWLALFTAAGGMPMPKASFRAW